MMYRTQVLSLCVAALLMSCSGLYAGTWYVSVNAEPGGNGLTWETAFSTIQEGIDAASDGDEVLIGDGTYTGDGNRDISFDGKAITVRSLNGPQLCLINCEGSEDEPHRGFRFHSGESRDAILKGLTIYNGFASLESTGGGGISIDSSSPTISHCVLTNNTARSNRGGGIYCGSNAMPHITNCILASNLADSGGAIYIDYRSSSIITNCTITDNYSYWTGSAFRIDSYNTDVYISNSIIWNNRDGNGSSINISLPEVVHFKHCAIQGGWDGEGNIDQDPLIAFDGSDFHLLPGSPCVNVGSNGLIDNETEDLDGLPRITDGVVDIGAYEHSPAMPPAIAISSPEAMFIDPYGTLPANEAAIKLRNRTTGTLAWSAQTEVEWLTLTPATGESTGEINTIEMIPNPTGLEAGHYSGEIIIHDASDSTPLARINVDLFIGREILVEADGSGDYPTIQAAVDAAIHGDRITCGPGTYSGEGNRNIRLFGKAISLIGRKGPEETILECTPENQYYKTHGFYIRDHETPSTVISGFTVTNADGPHGGITCQASSPTITNCIVKGNIGRRGASRPSPATSHKGGGIILSYSSSTIDNSVLYDNSTDARTYGHAIASQRYSSPTISHCAIVRDTIINEWPAVSCDANSTMQISNSILWGTDINNSLIRYDDENSVIVNGSCIRGGWPGEGNIDEYPMFINFPSESDTPLIRTDSDEGYNLHLHRRSPCIDAGINELAPIDLFDFDQDGDTSEYTPFDIRMRDRLVGPSVDIGPFEYGQPAFLETTDKTVEIYVNPSIGRGETTITLQNTGDFTADWTYHTLSSWLSLSPSRGKILYDTQEITLIANAVNRPEGEYHTTITFTSRRAVNAPLTIPVRIVISSTQFRVEADGSGDFPTIQEAIDAAEYGRFICCGDGTYSGEGNRDISFRGKQIRLFSENGPENCIIDCQGDYSHRHRGFRFEQMEDEFSILQGFTICNGYFESHYDDDYLEGYGSAIRCISASPRILNCIFRNNTAQLGGAVFNSESSPLIEDCIFEGNEGNVMAIQNSNTSYPIIRRCRFHNNYPSSNYAYGVINNRSGSYPTISDCLFESNNSNRGTSGVEDEAAGSIINNCVFRANHSCCLNSVYSTTIVTNSLFQSQDCSSYPCIWSGDSTIDISNCTFVNNRSENENGSLISLYTSSAETPAPSITNCIFANNEIIDGASEISYLGISPVVTYSRVSGWAGEGNITDDPLFMQLPDDGGDGWVDDPDTDIDESANNDYGDLRLQAGSPCIDAGNNAAFTADLDTDLDGLPRFVDDPATDDTGLGNPPLIDMGPYEYQPSPESFLQTGLLHQGQATSISLNRSATTIQAGKTKRTKR